VNLFLISPKISPILYSMVSGPVARCLKPCRVVLDDRPISHRQFFRRVPNELLARYFLAKEVSLGLDLAELDDAKGVESIFDAFTDLPEDQQAAAGLAANQHSGFCWCHP
jgi:hypothetical protein